MRKKYGFNMVIKIRPINAPRDTIDFKNLSRYKMFVCNVEILIVTNYSVSEIKSKSLIAQINELLR